MPDTVISGATTANYTLVPIDEGASIYCKVTATNASGTDNADSNTVGPVGPAPVIVGTAWDPLKKHANVILSNSNRTATHSGDEEALPFLATDGFTTLKRYFEIHLEGVDAASRFIGIGTALISLAGNSFLGSDDQAIAWAEDGRIIMNGAETPLSPIAVFGLGDTACVAVDLPAKKIWWRKNAGNWNNNASADPATGVGGESYTLTDPMFPGASLWYSLGALTANFGNTAFTYTMPSGFVAWGT